MRAGASPTSVTDGEQLCRCYVVSAGAHVSAQIRNGRPVGVLTVRDLPEHRKPALTVLAGLSAQNLRAFYFHRMPWRRRLWPSISGVWFSVLFKSLESRGKTPVICQLPMHTAYRS